MIDKYFKKIFFNIQKIKWCNIIKNYRNRYALRQIIIKQMIKNLYNYPRKIFIIRMLKLTHNQKDYINILSQKFRFIKNIIILHSIKIKLKDISYDFDRDLEKINIFKRNLECSFKRLFIIIDTVQYKITNYNYSININFEYYSDNVLLEYINFHFNNFSTNYDKELFIKNFKNLTKYHIDFITKDIPVNLLSFFMKDIICKDSCLSYEIIIDKIIKKIIEIFLEFVKIYSINKFNKRLFSEYINNTFQKKYDRVFDKLGNFYFSEKKRSNYCYFCID